jgi:drug/metabolite transporter (DMT)-like permease
VSSPPRLAYAAWIAVSIIWGTTYLGIRVALDAFPPALLGGVRWTIAGLLLIAIAWARGERLPSRTLWRDLALQGLLMIGFGNGLVNWAEVAVPSGLAAVVIATSPFFMAGVEACYPDGDRLTARVVAGLLVGFAGIVVLVWPDLHLGDRESWRFLGGLLALQGACLAWAIGSAFSKRHPHGPSVIGSSAVQMLFGGLMMLAWGTLTGEWAGVHAAGRGIWATLYLIVVGAIGGFVSYVYALQHLPVATVSLYAYINPLIAVVLGALLLDEPFGPRTIAAMAVVFAGIALVRPPRAESGTDAAIPLDVEADEDQPGLLE